MDKKKNLKMITVRGVLDNDAFYPMVIEGETYNSITNYVYANLLENKSQRSILATAPIQTIVEKDNKIAEAIGIYLEYEQNKDAIEKHFIEEVFKSEDVGNGQANIRLFEEAQNQMQQYYEDNIRDSVLLIKNHLRKEDIQNVPYETLLQEKNRLEADNIKKENVFRLYNAYTRNEYESTIKHLFTEAYLSIFEESRWNTDNFDANRKMRNALIATGLQPIVSGKNNFIGEILMNIRHSLISKIIRTRNDDRIDSLYKNYIVHFLIHYELSHMNSLETYLPLNSTTAIIENFKSIYGDEAFSQIKRNVFSREEFSIMLKDKKIQTIITNAYPNVREFMSRIVRDFYGRANPVQKDDMVFDEYLKEIILRKTPDYPSDISLEYQVISQKRKKSLSYLNTVKERVLKLYNAEMLSLTLSNRLSIKFTNLESNRQAFFQISQGVDEEEEESEENDDIIANFRQDISRQTGQLQQQNSIFSDSEKADLRSFFEANNIQGIFNPILIELDQVETSFALTVQVVKGAPYIIDLVSNPAFSFLVETITPVGIEGVRYPTILHFVMLSYLKTFVGKEFDSSAFLEKPVSDVMDIVNSEKEKVTQLNISKFLSKSLIQKFSNVDLATSLKKSGKYLTVEPKERDGEDFGTNMYIAEQTEEHLNRYREALPESLKKIKTNELNPYFYKWLVSESKKVLDEVHVLTDKYYRLNPLLSSDLESYYSVLTTFLDSVYKPEMKCDTSKIDKKVPSNVSKFFYNYLDDKFLVLSKVENVKRQYEEQKKSIVSEHVSRTPDEILEFDEEQKQEKKDRIQEIMKTQKTLLVEEFQEQTQKYEQKLEKYTKNKQKDKIKKLNEKYAKNKKEYRKRLKALENKKDQTTLEKVEWKIQKLVDEKEAFDENYEETLANVEDDMTEEIEIQKAEFDQNYEIQKQRLKSELSKERERMKKIINYQLDFDRKEFLGIEHFVPKNSENYDLLTDDQKLINNARKTMKSRDIEKRAIAQFKQVYDKEIKNIKNFMQLYDTIIQIFYKKLYCVYTLQKKYKHLRDFDKNQTEEGIKRMTELFQLKTHRNIQEILKDIMNVSGNIEEEVDVEAEEEYDPERPEYEEESESEKEDVDYGEEFPEDEELD